MLVILFLRYIAGIDSSKIDHTTRGYNITLHCIVLTFDRRRRYRATAATAVSSLFGDVTLDDVMALDVIKRIWRHVTLSDNWSTLPV